ncbi:MAG: CHAT domain-containing protein, partial [Chloroflexota bacterium]|nr:CHAT domain-containing protein [Chloroflexota bacterium]
MHLLTITFSPSGDATDPPPYRLRLDSVAVGNASGTFTLPYPAATWRAIRRALEPDFALADADAETQARLNELGEADRWLQTIGAALSQALLATPALADGFQRALFLAQSDRQPLPVELRFGDGCAAVAALPWELWYHQGHFLVADATVALSRYPEGLLPPTLALAQLPLRVLLVISEPLDGAPVFAQGARSALLHGLRTLDEVGAVIVDQLRPPTFATLVEAVTNGHYHLLIFYGHGVHDDKGGQLLLEDEYGAGTPVRAADLGAALRNTTVRLVLLGACQSAVVNPLLPNPQPESEASGEAASIWQGTAAALIRAGVPLAIGMQTRMRVDAAQLFLKQFALSLAAGKPILQAVAEARKPLLPASLGASWFVPALYGRPAGEGVAAQHLFDPAQRLPPANAALRASLHQVRAEIEQLERSVGSVGVLGQAQELVALRAARQQLADVHFQLARRTPGGYATITSPLYGVPHNRLFVGRSADLIAVGRALRQPEPVVIWGAGGLGKSALAAEVAHRQGWRYAGGVLWLDCQGGPAFDTLLERMAAFAGMADLSQTPPDTREPTVRAALARLNAPCLLIWDNAEDVWDDRRVQHFVRAGLPANCQALLTTRRDPDEAMWPTHELRPLAASAMHRLFAELAASAGVKVAAGADLAVIEPMLRWLAGHPLAVTLIVPLTKRRGLRRVWADLQARPLQGIEAAFNLSYARLTA